MHDICNCNVDHGYSTNEKTLGEDDSRNVDGQRTLGRADYYVFLKPEGKPDSTSTSKH
ncbi:hypothetical protein Goari_019108 [Gossypium aridum]|uniref:Uncharacterized protein n=1 Tax=Gossypium aridum TaxID=34290 RepID=A0A7J8WRS0_GOSAI|nr:hypothetical protein [Gossypium aridum]